MKTKTGYEMALWAGCLLVGSTVLYAEWRVAAHRPVRMESAPVVAAASDVVPDVPPVFLAPAPAAENEATPGVDVRLVARLLVDSVTQVESSGNPRMVGRHGERGLMQIKAGTWADASRSLFGKRVSFDRAFEPKLNQQVGAAYLAELQKYLARHERLWRADERALLLACYNAGPERVKRAGFDLRRLPSHTQDYVKRASALHDALLVDHHVDPARIRLAMNVGRPQNGG